MIIDGAFIYHLTRELTEKLENSRLEKIFLQSEDSFIFQFYYQGKKHRLILDLSPDKFGTYITNKTTNNTDSSQFLVSLKKQLEGGILTKIEQYLTDRVIIFVFTVYDFIDGPIEKQLIFEAMGKHSNLLLVQNDKIIDTHKKMFFETGRQLIPGATFEHFPTDKKPFDHIDFTVIEYPKMISNMYMGISLKLATYLYEKQIQIKEIKVKPTKDLDKPNGYWTDIFAIDHKKKYYETLSELLDDQETKNVQFKQSYQLFVDKQLKKYMRKKASLDQSLIDSTKKLEDRRYGDLIYQSGINLSEKRSSITVYDTDIELDATLTLNENAQKYYKAYQKAKRGVAFIKEQLDETKSLIELFESFNTYLEISNEADIKDLENDLMPYGYKAKKQKPSKKKQTIPNIVKIEDLDAVYLVGKNHLQNAYVTHELARSTDFFFHVKDAPGSHVVVQTESLNEPIIRKASMLAAYFSSLRHSSSIPVDYTSMKYVKKIPKVPGYKVMIKNQKTMFIDIDEDLIKTYL